MNTTAVPYLAGSLLLLLAGAAKLRRPLGTRQALRTQGLPSAAWLVRTLGAVEVVLAVAALAQVPGAAAGTALAYLGFSAFVVLALVRDRPLSSCGCFAGPDVPPTPAHVVVTVLAAAAATLVALGRPAGVPALLDAGPAVALAVTGSAVLVAWLALLLMTRLPELVALRGAAA
ncbi:MauE/DoxX family redox-associated membrane protein [Kineococcus rubinsiae]|uniref:MauE/DoxX family redox-associated membrane protein n=1 Tax=Kineococcus rubinsiae TaxID=2609562 RepID=UPI00143172C2|nr:MauE/DoxX family redox-associated membrane protein [Kineococcus rubinsiae]NIZ89577.1 hypothetical protein [Kineococcus rubinsiae]